MAEIKVLFVHGVGNHHNDLTWQQAWTQAVREQIAHWDSSLQVKTDFAMLDDIFDQHEITFAGTMRAVGLLVGSGIGGLWRRRGLFETVSDRVRWTAGMVVQWVENETLRRQTRQRVQAKVQSFSPNVIAGHSLGSLVCYDAFTSSAGSPLIQGRTFISLGSQIGNPFVVGNFAAGRIAPLPAAKMWFHLYNESDRVFTAPISLNATNFEQVQTNFDAPGIANHDAVMYLTQPGTNTRVWRSLTRPLPAATRRALAAPVKPRKPDKKALLVGINDYPNPADHLEGCVNDVFLMSSVLQECGFDAEEIRVVLNDRATAKGILERLEWLLKESQPGDQRVFYYSGHGAQLPQYGEGDTVDHLDECLVPYDFDWQKENAVSDDQFYGLYSQLPYESYFVAILDCCHSGGMTRNGSRRIRAITPPDDIRHRMLKWEPKHQMWVARDLKPANKDLAGTAVGAAFVGASGATRRIGRAVPLRCLANKRYDAIRKDRHHHGPYLPVILEACQEQEYAYEYLHGATAHGAFTFVLSKILREYNVARRRPINFRQLMKLTQSELHDLQYDQTPVMVGPEKIVEQNIPWRSVTSVAARPKRRRGK